jgi:hypothetical protein
MSNYRALGILAWSVWVSEYSRGYNPIFNIFDPLFNNEFKEW